MSVRSHHTQSVAALQLSELVGDAWSSELVARLPTALDRQARSLKAFQRKRGLRSSSDLLRATKVYWPPCQRAYAGRVKRVAWHKTATHQEAVHFIPFTRLA